MKKSNKIIFLLIILLFQTIVYAQNNRTELDYANYLYLSGNYYEAQNAYHRYLFFNPNLSKEKQEEISFKIGLCYFKAEKYNESANLFLILTKNYRESHLSPFHSYYLAKSYERARQYKNAKKIYEEILGIYPNEMVAFNTKLGLISIMLHERKYEDANDAIISLKKDLNYPKDQENNINKVAQQIQNVSRPCSPLLAGFYSAILPGAGQFYLGEYKEGLYAFGLTASFGGLTAYTIYLEKHYKSRSERNYWAPSILGFITAIFYLSNIYNAVNLGIQINEFYYLEQNEKISDSIYQMSIGIPLVQF